ncbi:MAG TPA: tRNA guanosine(34) transglycosylase Tgt [Anaerolineales bacterium]|nr:tRNA guanosine(34) transglycosylase Tgt [Anaerolineales bacterium]
MSDFRFERHALDGNARAGTFHTPHGVIPTPVFAPVGTQATVKALTPAQVAELGASLVLSNTYHLYLRPGHELVREMGGLHAFMRWNNPILTDSGGFQVFSLSGINKKDNDGVTFKSHIDGSMHRFTPESATHIQNALGADIIMAFDQCPEPYDRAMNELALRRTHEWLVRCQNAHQRTDQALFGIVQGGTFADLRAQSAEFVASQGLIGNAIGGLSVGESKADMHAMLEVVCPILPADKPRYLMGVGSPEDLVNGVMRGIDIFDCVLPTRLARNHAAMTRRGRLNIRNRTYFNDPNPLEADCTCYTCQNFSRAYLRHLCVAEEMLAASLLSIHNLHLLVHLAAEMRQQIQQGTFQPWADAFLANYTPTQKQT